MTAFVRLLDSENITMVLSRKYVVRNIFHKRAKKEDFELVEETLPPIKKGEILVKTEWISVDPYQRSRQDLFNLPYTQYGYQVGTVIESHDPDFPVDTKVVSHEGWCEYSIIKPSEKKGFEEVRKIPNLRGYPESYAIGVMGMPGATAYFVQEKKLHLKSGDTVVLSCAAGAVASIVGQMAKIKGCRVIGIVGSDAKVKWLENELGFDKAINYKTEDVDKALKDAAPNGIDCYLDGVGGEISSTVMSQMNQFGKVCVYGWISGYNDETIPKATIIQPSILHKMLTVKGFIVWQYLEEWSTAFDQIIQWIQNGQIQVKENVVHGFENMFEAFDAMMTGANMGKIVVKI